MRSRSVAQSATRTPAPSSFSKTSIPAQFYFIEVNPRIQVEHTVTENITGIDIVKAQILIAGGATIGEADSGVPVQSEIRAYGHAMQCRITTEDPENNFIPDYGVVSAYRSPAGFGIRLDAGTAYAGARITPYYDSMLVKVTAWGRTHEETGTRMRRALSEFRIRGVRTNLPFLSQLLLHPQFQSRASTRRRSSTRHPSCCEFPDRTDQVGLVLGFVGDVIVNGNPEVSGERRPHERVIPKAPPVSKDAPPRGTKQLLDELGAEKFAQWMRAENRVLVTDTTLRDAHQSLLATRMRTHDMLEIAPVYARLLPELLSLECWGGATFDVAMRFLGRVSVGRGSRRCASACRTFCCRCCCARRMRWATRTIPTTSCSTSCAASADERHRSVPRVRFAELASTTCASRSTRCARPARSAKPRSATRAI